MSSKLVRKGLDLVNSERDFKLKKRKSSEGNEKQPSKKRKKQPKTKFTNKNDRPRGLQGMRLSSGQLNKEQDVDYTEKNLEYFKKTTWKINKDTYHKILERQNKFQKKKTLEENQEESETEGTGLFDD